MVETGGRYRHYKGDIYHVLLTAKATIDDRRVVVYSADHIPINSRDYSIGFVARNPEYRSDPNCYPEIEYFRVNWRNGEWLALRSFLPEDREEWENQQAKFWVRSTDNFTEILGNTRDVVAGTMYSRFQHLGEAQS